MALFDVFKKRIGADHFKDLKTSKGGSKDQSNRQIAGAKLSDAELLSYYKSGGFTQTIIDRIAKDSVRNWFSIKCDYNGKDIGRMIQNRFDELGIRKKIKELMTWKMVFNSGSAIYISTSHNDSIGKQDEPITLSTLKAIDFINVIDEPSRLSIQIPNRNDVSKKDYNKIDFFLGGTIVDPSRIRWICESFVPQDREGTSVAQRIKDAIIAADNGLWSSSLMLKDIGSKVFKSKWLLGLSPLDRANFLAQLSYTVDSQSAIALDTDEEYSRIQNGSLQGIQNVYDFIMDYLAGTAGISRLVLLGKAHGVVGSDDNEAYNYYASIKQNQISDIVPILDYLVKLVLHEQSGEIFKLTKGESKNLDWEIEPESLVELSPKAKAEIRLLDSQADQIDITIGKASPQEVKELDERYSGILDSEEISDIEQSKLNLEPPPLNPMIPEIKNQITQGQNLNG